MTPKSPDRRGLELCQRLLALDSVALIELKQLFSNAADSMVPKGLQPQRSPVGWDPHRYEVCVLGR